MPPSIEIHEFNDQWQCKHANIDDITTMIEGSVMYAGHDQRGNIHGCGGPATLVYQCKNIEPTTTINRLMSTRQHFNTMETCAMNEALQ